MANYYCTARTNYVHVKDLKALETALERWPIRIYQREDDGRIALFDEGGDSTGFWFYDDETDEAYEIHEYLAPHLVDGEVWVFMEAGSERQRYVVGHAFAFNSEAELRFINLNEIYDLAKELGDNVTVASY
jgi:hypothetical protein